jgi:hypothetical protein
MRVSWIATYAETRCALLLFQDIDTGILALFPFLAR